MKVDLKSLSETLRVEVKKTKAVQKIKDLVKRLRTIEMLLGSENKPEHMVLTVVPVIPPELRPLVMLESGNFATSDLNDLYRRLINRNNRLKRLLELNAPEVIIRNERRMLQQAVDALFDNSRCRRPVLGTNNRPLKSLADIIKGKQGRFRENLLGKRVDYSGRSVIVVGPHLKLHQCGLPKKIALELFQTFVIRRLKELGKAETIKNAKKMIERREEIVWDILDEVIHDHPVLLNRAPTLHRMGIQAFQPVLVESQAIELHPLVCPPFNADFDGDQMAVHLPLSYEAQIEAKTLMLSTQNVFSPADGRPIITPTQDMVLGIYYMTLARDDQKGEGKRFSSAGEAILAYDQGKIGIHAWIEIRLPKTKKVQERTGPPKEMGRLRTTVGRILFNEVLPPEMPFYNYTLNKKAAGAVVSDCHRLCGKHLTIKLLDDLKELGFKYSTRAGISVSKDDMRTPADKDKIIKASQAEVDRIEKNYAAGVLTSGERYNEIIDVWTRARERVSEVLMQALRDDTREGKPYLNSIFIMVDSGARGSQDQVRQLAGMRGLMAQPSGRIIETPILSNFREGLTVLEYFSSTHGARKGLADTALKTADAGYLTRKLVDVSQNNVVSMDDCGTVRGVQKGVVYKGDRVEVPLSGVVFGRVARDTIVDPVTEEIVVKENDMITEKVGRRIEDMGLTKIRVRSTLVCEAKEGVCARCYGMDLSTGRMVEHGMAVGIIAAQSIGEPGTQLTMRTFHIGGVAIKSFEQPRIYAQAAGTVRFENARLATRKAGETVVVNRNAEVRVFDAKEREIERYILQAGSILKVEEGQKVKPQTLLATWDPHTVPILTALGGVVKYEQIVPGETLGEEREKGVLRRFIKEHKGELHPQILILDPQNQSTLEAHPLPEGAYLDVHEGATVRAGTVLAKTPREQGGTQDITGGLPRVTELFEARRPKDAAVIAEVDGIVELGETKRGRRTIYIKPEGGGLKPVGHIVPSGRHLRVHTGDRVRAGDPLTEGPLVPQEILRIRGEEHIQNYLLNEVQSVYRAQGVSINDKHIELIVGSMMRKVRVAAPGDTKYLPGMIVDRQRLAEENDRVKAENGKPAVFKPLLLGITKAAIQSDSFIAAASFQETTKVLTEAALAGRRDMLVGLKENVIIGHLVPAGTGFSEYLAMRLIREEPELTAEEAAAETEAEGPGEGRVVLP
jgi:DNA-directed RNA polymerase subunit beta'